jgi:hypothetical protein
VIKLGSHWTGFSLSGVFAKISQENQSLIKIGQKEQALGLRLLPLPLLPAVP